ENVTLPRERMGLLKEAFKAAYELPEPNRIVSVAAWPLRVLVAVGSDNSLQEVHHLLATISEEPHGLRRLDGLGSILGAVLPSEKLRNLVLPVFVQAADASSGWRTERLVSFMAEALCKVDRGAASDLLRGRSVNRFTSKAQEALARMRPPP